MTSLLEVPYRFSLLRLMLSVTVLCLWLGLYSVDIELFVGVGLLAFTGIWMRIRYRKFFRKGVFALHELLSVLFFLCIGFGLVARYVASYVAI